MVSLQFCVSPFYRCCVALGIVASLLIIGACAASSAQSENASFIPDDLARWRVTKEYAGSAGLSLYGLDYEERVTPRLGDQYILTRFDYTSEEHWASPISQDLGIIKISSASLDTRWSRGSIYAFSEFAIFDDHFRLVLEHNASCVLVYVDGKALASEACLAHCRNEDGLGCNSQNAPSRNEMRSFQVMSTGNTELPIRATFDATLSPGSHRLLLKFITQAPESAHGTQFRVLGLPPQSRQFSTTLQGSASCHRLRVIQPDGISIARTQQFPRSIHVGLVPATAAQGTASNCDAIDSYRGRLVLKDYNQEVVQKWTLNLASPMTSISLPKLSPGYYTLSADISERGTSSTAFPILPSEGFSVIGGDCSFWQRTQKPKVASTYYFLATAPEGYRQFIFPYLRRLGISRNVGGHNRRNLELYQEAKRAGIDLTADFWNEFDVNYIDRYISETVDLVSSYKSYNEIDISLASKFSSSQWADKEANEYRRVKALNPDAIYIGSSFVQPGRSQWFIDGLRAGMNRTRDAWDVHVYPKYPPKLGGPIGNSQNEGDLGIQSALRQSDVDGPTLPFWLGETGARASHGIEGRRWQANMIAKLVAWAGSRPDFQVIGFLRPWYHSPTGNGRLNDIEIGHMPGEAALYTAISLMDGMAYERVNWGNTVEVARFGKGVLIAWSLSGVQTVSVSLGRAEEWIVLDVVGRIRPLAIADDGKASLLITSAPQYILRRIDYDQLIGDEFCKNSSIP